MSIPYLQQPPSDDFELEKTYHKYWKRHNLEVNNIPRLQDQKENTVQPSTSTELNQRNINELDGIIVALLLCLLIDLLVLSLRLHIGLLVLLLRLLVDLLVL